MRNKFFVFCVFLFFLTYCERGLAVPAYPYKVSVQVENGKIVDIFLQGDENKKYAFTIDGYTLLNEADGWWYADISSDGYVFRSSYKLLAKEDETAEIKKFKESIPKQIIPEGQARTNCKRIEQPFMTKNNGPIIGERHALVILMEFQDVDLKKTNDDFESIFNMLGYNYDDAIGSVRDYYRFASQEQLDYLSDIYGPYKAKYSMKYYGGNLSNGIDSNPLDLCIEAMRNLPEGIDFLRYDNDGDGIIDNVHIIYAGYGEEAGATSDAIWAHEYPHRISLKNELGITLAGYSCSPELRGNRGTKITHIGVICHELGHALGALDYYDTNYGTGGEYLGTGVWDIMASGSWNDDGRSPANFNPYVRSEVFGWNKIETLMPEEQVAIPRYDVMDSNQSFIYKIETGNSGDYFLLENRQRIRFDSALPGDGLMIYHIHPNIERYSSTNSVNASHPQCLYPVCASGSTPNKRKYGNINSNECPFPGRNGITSFSSSTFPAAIAWDGSSSDISISDIRCNSSSGTLYFSTNSETIIIPENPDTVTEKNLVYKESFETSITNRLTIVPISGKEIWRNYKKGNYIMYDDSIPSPTDGERILTLYSSKGMGVTESELISPFIQVEAGHNYILSFDIYANAISSLSYSPFSFFIEDDNGEYKVYYNEEATKQWLHVELPLVFAGDRFRYKMNGCIKVGGLFIDNLCLYKEEDVTLIRRCIADISNNYLELYSINGKKINSEDLWNLPDGLYIKRERGKTKKIVIK